MCMWFACVWFLSLQCSEQAMGTVEGRIFECEYYFFFSHNEQTKASRLLEIRTLNPKAINQRSVHCPAEQDEFR